VSGSGDEGAALGGWWFHPAQRRVDMLMSSDPCGVPGQPLRGAPPLQAAPPPAHPAPPQAYAPSPAQVVPPASPATQPPEVPAASPTRPESAVKFTRTAATWTALIVGLSVFIVLLVFITQNTESARLAFLGWHWSLPLGVGFLLAAAGGALITTLSGVARIVQLRRAARKNLEAAR
jgi:uncharacterized integral membrane protein